jgi:GT2 family glycosyltransferase
MSLRFSVVVPTYNRPDQLRGCLGALADLDYPRERFEVIVVDDGGAADLTPVVDEVAGRVQARLIRQENAGPGPARNSGAAAARAPYVVFTDDDCRPRRDWLAVLDARLSEHPDALIGGPTENLLPDDPFATTWQTIIEMVYDYFNEPNGPSSLIASNNMAVPRATFLALGGFDLRYRWAGAEDRELCARWIHEGGRIIFVPEARLGHGHPMTIGSFCRLYFRYGRGAYLYHRRRGADHAGTFSTDIGFHLNLVSLLRHALGLLPPRRRVAVVPLLGVWQLANLAGFCYQAVTGVGAAERQPAPVLGAALEPVLSATPEPPLASGSRPEGTSRPDAMPG